MEKITEEFISKCEFDKNCSPELKKVKFSNNTIHLRHQCNTCGKVSGNPVSKYNRNLSVIPAVDEVKLKEYDERIAYKLNSAVEHHKIAIQFHKEHKANRVKLFEEIFNVKYENFEQAYNIYLKSDQWKIKRKKILKRDNYVCRICKTNNAEEVHHLNYQNLCDESELELLSVCSIYHKLVHFRNDID